MYDFFLTNRTLITKKTAAKISGRKTKTKILKLTSPVTEIDEKYTVYLAIKVINYILVSDIIKIFHEYHRNAQVR